MTRVAIADDHDEMRVVLKLFLELDPAIEVVCSAVNGAEALTCAQQFQPDILIMDTEMPVMDGLEATKQIIQQQLSTRVILTSLLPGSAVVTKAKDAGAAGYVPKEKLPNFLLEAIHTIQAGGTFFLEK